jgi:hypothetical protein
MGSQCGPIAYMARPGKKYDNVRQGLNIVIDLFKNIF